MAAKDLKINPTLEGGLDFKKNLTEAIDGFTGRRGMPTRSRRLFNDMGGR